MVLRINLLHVREFGNGSAPFAMLAEDKNGFVAPRAFSVREPAHRTPFLDLTNPDRNGGGSRTRHRDTDGDTDRS